MTRQSRTKIAITTVLIAIALLAAPALCRIGGEVGDGGAQEGTGTPARPAQVENATVRLEDDRTLTGTLRLIHPGLYLLQSDERLYEISEEEIVAIGLEGGGEPPELSHDARRLIPTQTYEIVAANGDVEKWYTTQVTNESQKAWTYVQFGAKESELEMYRRMEVFDDAGNQLTFEIERRPESELYDVTIPLAVPAVPGERVSLSQRLHQPGMARRDGDTFTFTFMGDFPEDRILLRKVKLPRGAEIVRVEPEPVYQFEHEGSKVVVWRRYFPAGQRFPLTIVYRLSQ